MSKSFSLFTTGFGGSKTPDGYVISHAYISLFSIGCGFDRYRDLFMIHWNYGNADGRLRVDLLFFKFYFLPM